VSNNKELPNNWLIYIPNFRILETAVVKKVDPSLTVEDIKEGITWPGKFFEMINVERLKYLSHDSNTLMYSNSMKIIFNSSLLPEYIYIWKIKLRIYPYVNRIRKYVVKCCHWGYSSNNCKEKDTCLRCGNNHSLNERKAERERCANCRKD